MTKNDQIARLAKLLDYMTYCNNDAMINDQPLVFSSVELETIGTTLSALKGLADWQTVGLNRIAMVTCNKYWQRAVTFDARSQKT